MTSTRGVQHPRTSTRVFSDWGVRQLLLRHPRTSIRDSGIRGLLLGCPVTSDGVLRPATSTWESGVVYRGVWRLPLGCQATSSPATSNGSAVHGDFEQQSRGPGVRGLLPGCPATSIGLHAILTKPKPSVRALIHQLNTLEYTMFV